MSLEQFCQNKLLAYCQTMYPEFQIAPHHKLIAKHLEMIERREIKRLIISMPPRHGKSMLCSQYFPAWYLAKNPNHQVISASYGQELANDFGRAVRDLVVDDRTVKIFGKDLCSDDSTSKRRFNMVDGGAYFAVGRGGSITGRGGDIIIIDDLIKNSAEAQSPQIRKNLIDWYKNTLYTRLMPNGAIVVIATRWHQEDLTGYLLENSDDHWVELKLPAIDNGKALWPEFYNLDSLVKIKKEIGTREFDALYQQDAKTEEGNIIKREWIDFYDTLPKTPNPQWLMTWDLSFKGNENSDFVVGQLWLKSHSDYYLVDQVRGRFDFVETINQINYFAQKYPQARGKVIEDAANGAAVFSQLRSKVEGLILWKPKTSKDARLQAVSPLFEAGNIHVPRYTPWIDDYVEELVGFPYMANDDQVDATTMALIKFGAVNKSSFMASSSKTISSSISTTVF